MANEGCASALYPLPPMCATWTRDNIWNNIWNNICCTHMVGTCAQWCCAHMLSRSSDTREGSVWCTNRTDPLAFLPSSLVLWQWCYKYVWNYENNVSLGLRTWAVFVWWSIHAYIHAWSQHYLHRSHNAHSHVTHSVLPAPHPYEYTSIHGIVNCI